MLTAVILNWRRPDNVRRIVASYDRSVVSNVLVWDNANTREEFGCPTVRSDDLGLYTRFALGLLAPTEGVLIQDDDIELGRETVQALEHVWSRDRTILHGLFGRRPKPDGSYAIDHDMRNGEVEVVLTRALVVSKKLLAAFFLYLPDFDEVQRDSRPHGNGEDIILSYVAMRESCSANRTYHFNKRELPAPHAIHARSGHGSHRTRLMRFCENWLKETRHEDRGDMLHLPTAQAAGQRDTVLPGSDAP